MVSCLLVAAVLLRAREAATEIEGVPMLEVIYKGQCTITMPTTATLRLSGMRLKAIRGSPLRRATRSRIRSCRW